jgi:hypothetical protein
MKRLYYPRQAARLEVNIIILYTIRIDYPSGREEFESIKLEYRNEKGTMRKEYLFPRPLKSGFGISL